MPPSWHSAISSIHWLRQNCLSTNFALECEKTIDSCKIISQDDQVGNVLVQPQVVVQISKEKSTRARLISANVPTKPIPAHSLATFRRDSSAIQLYRVSHPCHCMSEPEDTIEGTYYTYKNRKKPCHIKPNATHQMQVSFSWAISFL